MLPPLLREISLKPALRMQINAMDYSKTMNFLYKREENSMCAMSPPSTLFNIAFPLLSLWCQKISFPGRVGANTLGCPPSPRLSPLPTGQGGVKGTQTLWGGSSWWKIWPPIWEAQRSQWL